MASTPGRFRDPRSTTYDFIGSILVRCPGCGRVARVVPMPEDSADEGRSAHRGRNPCTPRRLVCHGCGLSRTWHGRQVTFSHGTARQATDPYFGLPLWLQTRTRHGWLWAYDLEHLDLIGRFVQASLRERAPWYDTWPKMTLVARLPVWIKQARHRDEILRAVGRIRSSLVAA